MVNTYNANFGPHALIGDVEEILSRGLLNRSADVVVGGPPCQGFSNLSGNRPDDPRRSLWRAYLDALRHLDASVFVLENVPNFLKSSECACFVAGVRELGYAIEAESAAVVNSADYGVPQNRFRAVIIGSRIGKIALPEPSPSRRTIRNAFTIGCWNDDVPIPRKPTELEIHHTPVRGPELHLARSPMPTSTERYRAIPAGGNRFDLFRSRPDLTPDCWKRKTSGGTDIFGRLWWDRPAATIRTEFFKPEKGRFLHPVEHRAITHWEALRLQTFPDWFQWIGSKSRIAMQIGNAVPPLLSKAIADEIAASIRCQKIQNLISIRRRRRSAA